MKRKKRFEHVPLAEVLPAIQQEARQVLADVRRRREAEKREHYQMLPRDPQRGNRRREGDTR